MHFYSLSTSCWLKRQQQYAYISSSHSIHIIAIFKLNDYNKAKSTDDKYSRYRKCTSKSKHYSGQPWETASVYVRKSCLSLRSPVNRWRPWLEPCGRRYAGCFAISKWKHQAWRAVAQRTASEVSPVDRLIVSACPWCWTRWQMTSYCAPSARSAPVIFMNIWPRTLHRRKMPAKCTQTRLSRCSEHSVSWEFRSEMHCMPFWKDTYMCHITQFRTADVWQLFIGYFASDKIRVICKRSATR